MAEGNGSEPRMLLLPPSPRESMGAGEPATTGAVTDQHLMPPPVGEDAEWTGRCKPTLSPCHGADAGAASRGREEDDDAPPSDLHPTVSA